MSENSKQTLFFSVATDLLASLATVLDDKPEFLTLKCKGYDQQMGETGKQQRQPRGPTQTSICTSSAKSSKLPMGAQTVQSGPGDTAPCQGGDLVGEGNTQQEPAESLVVQSAQQGTQTPTLRMPALCQPASPRAKSGVYTQNKNALPL
jgi:hypothetical protein